MIGEWNRIGKAGRAGSDHVDTSTFRPKDHELSLYLLTISLSKLLPARVSRARCVVMNFRSRSERWQFILPVSLLNLGYPKFILAHYFQFISTSIC